MLRVTFPCGQVSLYVDGVVDASVEFFRRPVEGTERPVIYYVRDCL